METQFATGNPLAEATDAAIVPIFTGPEGPDWSDLPPEIASALGEHLPALAADARFSGKRGSSFVVPTLGMLAAKRLILLGLGTSNAQTPEIITRAYGAALRAARDAGAREVAAILPAPAAGLAAGRTLEAASLGMGLAAYRFDRYRGSAAPDSASAPQVESVRFFTPALTVDAAARALGRAAAIAGAVALARDLANEPGASLTPARFAEYASTVAADTGLSIEILGPQELADIGAEATLAVGGGSVHPPRLIRLRYQPEGEASTARVPGLVGKAITFDTGGYSIKPYEGMLTMKGDMAGGAAVLGAMSALRALECPLPVEATICAAENMISGAAFRPGDVLRGMNGVTMEILSTDAEGRLVLADGLVDTARRGATELIDLATLTGAAVVALGEGTTALFASDDDLAARLLVAAEESGERMWRMPLIDDLERKIEGDVADIKNSGGRAGGAITAALFLQHFREGLPWAHLDIAGSSRQDKAGPLGPKGATGVGVRTLLAYLMPDTADEGAAA